MSHQSIIVELYNTQTKHIDVNGTSTAVVILTYTIFKLMGDVRELIRPSVTINFKNLQTSLKKKNTNTCFKSLTCTSITYIYNIYT